MVSVWFHLSNDHIQRLCTSEEVFMYIQLMSHFDIWRVSSQVMHTYFREPQPTENTE